MSTYDTTKEPGPERYILSHLLPSLLVLALFFIPVSRISFLKPEDGFNAKIYKKI